MSLSNDVAALQRKQMRSYQISATTHATLLTTQTRTRGRCLTTCAMTKLQHCKQKTKISGWQRVSRRKTIRCWQH